MVDVISEVDVFIGISDWSTKSTSTIPSTPAPAPAGEATGFHAAVPGKFYYRNKYFNASALSLVVCCGRYGIYTPEDTAHMVSQQQHRPQNERKLTGDDMKGVLRKVVLENSTAYQTLKDAGPESSLVRGILAPMATARCEPMRSYINVFEYKVRPTWFPRVRGPRPPELPLRLNSIREIPSGAAEQVKSEQDSAQVLSESPEEVKNKDLSPEPVAEAKKEDSFQIHSESIEDAETEDAGLVHSEPAEDVKAEIAT